MSDNDLIQKGQDDLIRRGDAKARFSERGLAFVRSGLDAIPAVQPTVKPLGADGVTIHPQDILNAAWRDDLGEEGLAMYARILAALDMQPTVSPKQLAAQPDDVAALVEALEQAKDFIDDQYACAESQAVQGEYVAKDARQLWYMLCAALARVKGEIK